MIRDFKNEDMLVAREIHAASGLDERCFPNLTITTPKGEEILNPLFIVKGLYEHNGRPAVMSFLKVTSELYLLVDHAAGTPEERWEWLQELKEWMKGHAWKHGLEQMTAFVPSDVEKSFEKRLLDLGFVKSPWTSYTLNLE